MKTSLLATLFLFFIMQVSTAFAAEAPEKESKRTIAGLYVTAKEAYDMKMQDPEHVILVDVRDPIEIMFTGNADDTDIYVPFKLTDRTAFDPQKSVYEVHVNKDFASEVIAELDKNGANKQSKIIFMCRSGSTRSAPAADLLYKQGYKNVYSMVDGFEGGKAKEGLYKGARVKNGWKNSNLPWGWKLDPNKAYISID